MQAEERRRAILDSLRNTDHLSAPQRWPAAFPSAVRSSWGILLCWGGRSRHSATPGLRDPARGHRSDPPGGRAARPRWYGRLSSTP